MNKDKNAIIRIIEWVIHIVVYSIVLLLMSCCFKSFTIDYSYFGLFAIVAVVIIYLLNLTIKPIIVFLTLPITGLTLGLFYPAINLFILKLTDWILGKYFDIDGLLAPFFIAILISLINIIIDEIIIKPLIRRLKKNG